MYNLFMFLICWLSDKIVDGSGKTARVQMWTWALVATLLITP